MSANEETTEELRDYCPTCQHEHNEGAAHSCRCPDCGRKDGRHNAGCGAR